MQRQNSRFSVSSLKEEKLIKKQTYMKTKTRKLYSRVFWTFLPNDVKIDPYNIKLYRFKVKTFFLRHSVVFSVCVYVCACVSCIVFGIFIGGCECHVCTFVHLVSVCLGLLVSVYILSLETVRNKWCWTSKQKVAESSTVKFLWTDTISTSIHKVCKY